MDIEHPNNQGVGLLQLPCMRLTVLASAYAYVSTCAYEYARMGHDMEGGTEDRVQTRSVGLRELDLSVKGSNTRIEWVHVRMRECARECEYTCTYAMIRMCVLHIYIRSNTCT
jgi:hypothetical protein